ncbi:uncharacterized protein SPPG_03948 [Spizellomyces punctatus DAOM BR117]|uniref:Mpv17/PMP22 family protein n=1 Tax=Spizellomyces punctatus (strain DAOM BR117) TaxID=645134 RepID=A0A0L0HJ34_SPIPD|nr:uncharacterized protein SPPG_03948 [Spizellomyces punctatus DAOM BR117]KND00844.1 hypothetical protein SPPG_03948 [Spizellomyces punctatus DAOM BR117]|eukprot:XP_016608883.1 hypothetical protein SPPG_03948 [Spizellomyces punctatus DAOM BR117]
MPPTTMTAASAFLNRTTSRPGFQPITRAWKRYLQLLEEKPLITKSLSAGAIGVAGDIIAQRIDSPSEHKKWDPKRTLRLGVYGMLIGAPLTHGWYKILDRRIGGGMDMATSLKKVAMDQLLAAAPFTALFFVCNSYMEGCTRPQIQERLQSNLWPTLKANWAVWPAALAINFRFVPLKCRVLVVNILGLGWGTYLSMVQHREHAHKKTHLPDPYPPDSLPVPFYPPGNVKEQ